MFGAIIPFVSGAIALIPTLATPITFTMALGLLLENIQAASQLPSQFSDPQLEDFEIQKRMEDPAQQESALELYLSAMQKNHPDIVSERSRIRQLMGALIREDQIYQFVADQTERQDSLLGRFLQRKTPFGQVLEEYFRMLEISITDPHREIGSELEAAIWQQAESEAGELLAEYYQQSHSETDAGWEQRLDGLADFLNMAEASPKPEPSKAKELSIPTITPSDGLVAYYPFSGDAKDASGNRHHGSGHGAGLTQDRFGNLKSAYAFNGWNDYIEVGPMGRIPTTGTVTFWMYPAIVTPRQGLFCTDIRNTGFRVEIDDSYLLTLTVGDGNDLPHYVIYDFVSHPFDKDYWYHVAFAWDRAGNNIQGWFNGIQAFNQQHTLWPVTLRNVKFGNGFDADNDPPRWFNGTLDEFRYYSRILSDAEIQKFYSNRPPVLEKNFLAIDAGQTITLTPDNFVASDPNDDSVKFLTSEVKEGRFEVMESSGNWGVSDSFTLTQVQNSQARFVSTSNLPPGGNIRVNDGIDSTGSAPIQFYFRAPTQNHTESAGWAGALAILNTVCIAGLTGFGIFAYRQHRRNAHLPPVYELGVQVDDGPHAPPQYGYGTM